MPICYSNLRKSIFISTITSKYAVSFAYATQTLCLTHASSTEFMCQSNFWRIQLRIIKVLQKKKMHQVRIFCCFPDCTNSQDKEKISHTFVGQQISSKMNLYLSFRRVWKFQLRYLVTPIIPTCKGTTNATKRDTVYF